MTFLFRYRSLLAATLLLFSCSDIKEAVETEVDGIKIRIVTPGKGRQTQAGDIVSIHYQAWMRDSSGLLREVPSPGMGGRPFEFVLGAGNVIPGWDKGVLGMQKGETRRLVVPSRLAYGKRGKGPVPPGAEVEFLIKLAAVRSPLAADKLPDVSSLSLHAAGKIFRIADRKKGTGTPAASGWFLLVHYSIWDSSGVLQRSTREMALPARMVLTKGKCPSGWERALLGMAPGGRRVLVSDDPRLKVAVVEVVESMKPSPPDILPDVEGLEKFSGPEGLLRFDLKKGDGKQAEFGSRVRLHVTAWTQTGRLLHSTRNNVLPMEFVIGLEQVLRAWELGTEGMRQGGVRLLKVPATLSGIPANSPDFAPVQFLLTLEKVF